MQGSFFPSFVGRTSAARTSKYLQRLELHLGNIQVITTVHIHHANMLPEQHMVKTWNKMYNDAWLRG
jgi:predicted TIM-barrel enzyme